MMTVRALPWLLCFTMAAGLGLFWLGTYPLFGDEVGYGYPSSSWIERNSMAPVPAGDGRGEQAMGHPALFFWLWALLIRIGGDTLFTARILPTLATGFALAGTWNLGRELGGSGRVGLMAVTGLLVSPLFLAQAYRALPESAHLASIVWALVFYSREQRLGAALSAVLATCFRFQGVFLGAAFLLADLMDERRLRWNLALWLSPLLVPVATGLLNLAANGYFFFPAHLGTPSEALAPGWILERLRYFTGHIMGEDFRWFPISVALAGMFLGRGKPGVLFFGVIALPALLHPPTRLAVSLGFPAFYILHLILRRRLPSPATTAMLLFSGSLVAFHVFIVAFSPDTTMNLFRYIIGVYPVIVLLPAMAVARLGRKTSWSVWGAFCLASATCLTAVRHPWQSEATVAGQLEAGAVREAVQRVPSPYHPDPRITSIPTLGYVNRPEAGSRDEVINIIVGSIDQAHIDRLLPEGYGYTGDTTFLWTHEGLIVSALEASSVP